MLPGSLALAPELARRALALLPWPSTSSLLSPEPDNEAHIRSSSRPCSPVHHHEGHTKLSSSPPRASPVRMGPSYVLKKGSGAVMSSAGDVMVASVGHLTTLVQAVCCSPEPLNPVAALACEREPHFL